jgi:hypothetical protein
VTGTADPPAGVGILSGCERTGDAGTAVVVAVEALFGLGFVRPFLGLVDTRTETDSPLAPVDAALGLAFCCCICH